MDEADKAKVNEKLEALRALDDSEDLEAIKKAQDELTTTFYEVSSKVYQAEAEQAAQQEGGAEQGAEAGQDEGPTGDNVVDADFEVEEDN